MTPADGMPEGLAAAGPLVRRALAVAVSRLSGAAAAGLGLWLAGGELGDWADARTAPNATVIIQDEYMSAQVAGIGVRARNAIATMVDGVFDAEYADYVAAAEGRRAGHVFEALWFLRHWLEGHNVDCRVETEVWVTNPEPAAGGYHYLMRARTKSINEVFEEVLALVGRPYEVEGLCPQTFITVDGADEHFGVYCGTPGTAAWPAGRIVVFPVTGGSEGWWVHVEVQTERGGRVLVLLGKNLGDGWDKAWELSRRLADILGV